MTSRIVTLTALALAMLATPAVAKDKDKVKAEAVPTESIVIPTPPSGKGQILFFRPGGTGFAVGCSVNENGQKISSLGAGRYFIMVATPGRHEYTVKSEAKDTLALNVEDGETQYASCKIKMGIMVGRPDIRPSTRDDFLKTKKLKMVDADDMGPGEGALRPDQLAAAVPVPQAK